MPGPSIIIKPEKQFTWERWQAGRAERRRLGNAVAPGIIRRAESSSDARLRRAFGGERGPSFEKGPPGTANPSDATGDAMPEK